MLICHDAHHVFQGAVFVDVEASDDGPQVFPVFSRGGLPRGRSMLRDGVLTVLKDDMRSYEGRHACLRISKVWNKFYVQANIKGREHWPLCSTLNKYIRLKAGQVKNFGSSTSSGSSTLIGGFKGSLHGIRLPR